MKKNNFDSKSQDLLIELPKVSDKSLAKRGKGWIWDEDLYSWVLDGDIYVYADGGSGWSDQDWGNGDGDGWGDNSGGGGTGWSSGDSEQVSSTIDYQHGMDVVDELERDLNNDEVVALEASKSADGSIDVVNSISLAVTAKNASHVIIDALKANAGVIGTIGKITGGLGVGLSGAQFYIGATDGEISPADWANAASAALGAVAIFFPVTIPITGTLSVIAGVASNFLPGDSGNNGNY